MIPTNPKPIDQEKRKQLCRDILAGSPTAVGKLARLYKQAGYKTLANVLLKSDGTIHANAVLS